MMLLYERKVEEGLAYFWRRAGRRGEERRGEERSTTVRARTMEMRARGGGMAWLARPLSIVPAYFEWPWSSMYY